MLEELEEIEYKDSPFYYQATLSDGTVIHVMAEGKALDLNGNTYTATFEYDEDDDITDVKYWTRDEAKIIPFK